MDLKFSMKELRLKNYTSTVPVDRTVSRIESILVSTGASNIVKDYHDGELRALCFMVPQPDGKKISIRLPVDSGAVHRILKASIKRPRPCTVQKLQDQAMRTAWKLMQDWVEVQISIIRMGQAEFLQVFLPYVWDGNRTFYTALKENDFKMLTSGTGE